MSIKKHDHDIEKHADIIKKVLKNPSNYNTYSDICVKTGLTMKQVEPSVLLLVSRHRGQISVAEKGQLLFKFPHGLNKKWESENYIRKFYKSIKDKVVSFSKVVIRSWISIVMVFYLIFFIVILLALFLRGSKDENRSNDSSGSPFLMHFIGRLFLDSLYWISHPFASFNYRKKPFKISQSVDSKNLDTGLKFHEKVNNFVFGIDNDALINEYSFKRKILNHIKINHGYTNIYDIMKITSLTKEDIQSILAKLVIDYNGKFIINSNGIVTYYFPELMLTIESEKSISKRIVSPIWLTKISIPAFTGNSTLSNALIFTFNAFNMGMSLFVIHNDLTIDKIKYILTSSNFSNFDCLYIDNAYNDAPILLGWIPLVFSISLFLIPTTRLLFRKRLIKQINNENGYRGIMKSIVNHIEHDNFNIPEENLIKEWKIFTGCDPDIKTLSKMIIDIGGEINIDKDGKILYSFEEMAKHNKALKEKKISKLKSCKKDGLNLLT